MGLFSRKPKNESQAGFPTTPGKPGGGLKVTHDGSYTARWRSPEEGKQVIKELKLEKKSLQLQRRQLNERERELRAAYTDHVRRQGSKFHGGGSFGKTVRTFQTISRDSNRAKLAKNLEPLEKQKIALASRIDSIDRLVLQIENSLL